MKSNIDKSKVIKSILSVICLILIIVSIFVIIKDTIAEKNSLTITATIKEIDYSNSNNFYNVEYKVNDEYYKNNIKLKNSNDLTVNDDVDIKVNQKNPEIIISSHLFTSAIIFTISLITLAICGPESFKFYQDMKKIKALKTSGLSLNVPITEVVTNNNARKRQGLLPSYLRCTYLNPKDNITYTFESKESYQNLQDIISRYNVKTVTVYLDRTNTKNYYVDLDSLNNQTNLIDPIEFMNNKPNEASKETNQEPSIVETVNQEEVQANPQNNPVSPSQSANLTTPVSESTSESKSEPEAPTTNKLSDDSKTTSIPIVAENEENKSVQKTITESSPVVNKTVANNQTPVVNKEENKESNNE